MEILQDFFYLQIQPNISKLWIYHVIKLIWEFWQLKLLENKRLRSNVTSSCRFSCHDEPQSLSLKRTSGYTRRSFWSISVLLADAAAAPNLTSTSCSATSPTMLGSTGDSHQPHNVLTPEMLSVSPALLVLSGARRHLFSSGFHIFLLLTLRPRLILNCDMTTSDIRKKNCFLH